MDEKSKSVNGTTKLAFKPEDPEYEAIRRIAEKQGVSSEEVNRNVMAEWQARLRRDGGTLKLYDQKVHGETVAVEVVRHDALQWSLITAVLNAGTDTASGKHVPIKSIISWTFFVGDDSTDEEPAIPRSILEQIKGMDYRLVGGDDNNWVKGGSNSFRRVPVAEIANIDKAMSMPRCVAEEAWDHVGIVKFLAEAGQRGFVHIVKHGLNREERFKSPGGKHIFSAEQFLESWREDRQNQTRLERVRTLNDFLRSSEKKNQVNWNYQPPTGVPLPPWLPREYWGVEHPMVLRVQNLPCYFHIYQMEKVRGVRLVLGVAGHPSNQRLLSVAKEVFGVRDDLGISRASKELWGKGLGYLMTLEIAQDGVVLRPMVSHSLYENSILSPVFALYDFDRAPRLLVDEVLIGELLKVYNNLKGFDPEQMPYQYGTVMIGKQEVRWLASDAGAQPCVKFEGDDPSKERREWCLNGVYALFTALAQPTKLIVLKPDPLPKKKNMLRRLKKQGRKHLRPLRALLWIEGKTYRPLEIFKPQKPSQFTGKKRDAHFVRGHFWLCPYGPRRSQRELRWRKFHVRGVGQEKGHDVAVKKVDIEDIPGVAYEEDKS